MRRFALASALVLVVVVFAAPAAAVNRGPEEISIYGGSRGNVPFPHAKHQQRLEDCKICHDLFPQQADAIKHMKAKGTLKPKKVMNILCIKCHRQEKRAGKPHGPLTCKHCHVK